MIPALGEGLWLVVVLASLIGFVAIAAIVFLLFMLIGSIRLRRQKQDQNQAEDGSGSA